ncbi:hypothetical protein McpSp1_08980 [Methanocorpusculaceae archaeon Sp1]|nr:hypothetical protein [Methanocorpusculaceae archaeon Sp1]
MDIEFISLIFTILFGFAGVFGFLIAIFQKVGENSEKIMKIRAEVREEFAMCNLHCKKGGIKNE